VNGRCRAALILSFSAVLGIAHASGQIIELREYHGKTISCVVSGLRGWGTPCGIDGGYTYVFVGSVLSVNEISSSEKRLQLLPEEVFLGAPASQLTAVTSQGDCLPDIAMGDHWLFYLRRDEKSHELRLDYGSPSKPVQDAQPEIATLRRLMAMTDSGLIKGSLWRNIERRDSHGTSDTTSVPIPNHKITLTRDDTGVEYSTVSDSDGNYEVDPLPVGSYRISTNTAVGLWAEDGPAIVKAKSCTAFHFELRPDGIVAGHVRSASGKRFGVHPWVDLVAVDGSRSQSVYVDDDGYFEARGLEPGRYFVGIGIASQSGTPEWKSRVYYPGVRIKEQATVVELGDSEKRTNLDFLVPDSVRR
jgi:Carboxypeptidase regulatory-like domain